MATTKAVTGTRKTLKKLPARVAGKRATATNEANSKVVKKVARKAATKKAGSAPPQRATRPATSTTASKRATSHGGARKPTAKTAAIKKTATTATAASKSRATKPAVKKTATRRASVAEHPAARPSARTSTANTAGKSARKLPLSATAAAQPSQTRASPRTTTAGHNTRRPRKITPRQALANTHELLDAKREHDRQPQPWQALDPVQSHVANAGIQSSSAMEKAEELHQGESRQAAIQGSISTQDRHNQGKRDNR